MIKEQELEGVDNEDIINEVSFSYKNKRVGFLFIVRSVHSPLFLKIVVGSLFLKIIK